MVITHKLQVRLNKTQEKLYNQTSGACRWAYNFFLELNITRYSNGERYLNNYDVRKIISDMKKTTHSWLYEVSQKAVQEAVIRADETYQRFFKNKFGFPRFKSRKRNFNDGFWIYPITPKKMKYNKIKLPKFGYVYVYEKKYIPHGKHILNANLKRDSLGKYFLTLSYEIEPEPREVLSQPMGIDVGIKNYLTISRPCGYEIIDSFLNDEFIKKQQIKITNFQKLISNKMEFNYGRILNQYMDKHHGSEPNEKTKNITKGESYNSNNIRKLQWKVNKAFKRINDYKKNLINTLVNKLAKSKPAYISIEDLSVSNMISKSSPNHVTTLSKHITESMFYYFKERLIQKCKQFSVEVRVAHKYFASSKKCSKCGHKKKNLTLDDRIYVCEKCGLKIDRDINASINLLNIKKYAIA